MGSGVEAPAVYRAAAGPDRRVPESARAGDGGRGEQVVVHRDAARSQPDRGHGLRVRRAAGVGPADRLLRRWQHGHVPARAGEGEQPTAVRAEAFLGGESQQAGPLQPGHRVRSLHLGHRPHTVGPLGRHRGHGAGPDRRLRWVAGRGYGVGGLIGRPVGVAGIEGAGVPVGACGEDRHHADGHADQRRVTVGQQREQGVCCRLVAHGINDDLAEPVAAAGPIPGPVVRRERQHPGGQRTRCAARAAPAERQRIIQAHPGRDVYPLQLCLGEDVVEGGGGRHQHPQPGAGHPSPSGAPPDVRRHLSRDSWRMRPSMWTSTAVGPPATTVVLPPPTCPPPA